MRLRVLAGESELLGTVSELWDGAEFSRIVPDLDDDGDSETLEPDANVLAVESTSDSRYPSSISEPLERKLVTIDTSLPVLSSVGGLLVVSTPLQLSRPSVCTDGPPPG